MPAIRSKLAARLIMTFGGLFLLMLIVHLVGIALLRYFVERELHPALPKGTYIGEVHLNLLSGRLEVEDFQLRKEGELRMRFGRLLLDVSPWRLLTGRLHVEDARLSNGYLRVDRLADGAFDLGLPPFGDQAPAEADAEPAPFSLAAARLERVTLEYHDGDLASLIYIDNLEVGAYSARAAQQEVPIAWALHWDGRSIAGHAGVSLDRGQVAASGDLETGLLDLGRAQRLARLEPVIEGEAGLRGGFTWQPPRLSLPGSLRAPWLAYGIAGRKVRVGSLHAPDISLELSTAPTLVLDLLGKGVTVDDLETAVGDQVITAGALQLTGRLRYADADQLELRDAQARVAQLAWQMGGRQVSASDLAIAGQVVQRLGGEDPFPSLNASLSAASLAYRDQDAATELQLNSLALDQVTLAPSDAEGTRRLAGTVALGDGRLTQGDATVDWVSVAATLSGAVADPGVHLATDLEVRGLGVATPALAAGPLKIAEVSATALDVGEETRFSRLRLQDIRLPAEREQTALRVAAVDLADGRYAPAAGVGIGEIVIDGLQTGVIRDKQGVWRHVLSGGPPAGTAPQGDGEAAKGGDLAWKIGGIRVTGDSHLTVADTLNPDMKALRYQVDRVEIGALSSTAPDTDTPFDIVLRPDAYSEFAIAGKVRPLADKLHLDAEGHLQGFGLTSVNGLVADDLGHRFLQGQLDDEFRITIANDRLEMGNTLGIAGVGVEELPGKEGPPLGMAIALLEDRDGNIKLEVPVSGNLGDPQFRVLGALNPIIMKAVAGTAALAIQPLGSVLLVGGLVADQALKVTFAPALFDPGSTQPNPAAQKYLGQLAAKLAEKPKLAVRLCGVVVDAERSRDKKGEYLDQEADLLAMAQQRADAARAYLASKGADRKQLRACRPTLDPDKAASPRVDIKF